MLPRSRASSRILRTFTEPEGGPQRQISGTRMRTSPFPAASLCVVFGVFVFAQAPAQLVDPQAAQPARFEAATIKRNTSGGMMVSVSANAGQYQATNVTVNILINQALRLPPPQIIGVPEWAQSERYDVVARVPPGIALSAAVQQEMMRGLLEERFKLATHKETRELPVYALVTARGDGRLGADLAVSKNDCTPGRGRAAGGPAPGPTKLGRGARPACGTMQGPGLLSAGGITMTRLAEILAGNLGRLVVDKTGLGGFYDLDLVYTPDQIPGPPPGPVPPGFQMPVIDPNGPSLTTAIQEQLGLKLESSRAAVDVTVIDRFERPTED
jgi:uncharacterized protein (TIGR03435 family)